MEFDRTESEIDYYCRYCCLCVVGCFNFIALLLVFINNPSLDLQISSRFLVSLSLSLQISYYQFVRNHTCLYIFYISCYYCLCYYITCTSHARQIPRLSILFCFLSCQDRERRILLVSLLEP